MQQQMKEASMCGRLVNLDGMIGAILSQVKLGGENFTPEEMALRNGWNTVLVEAACANMTQGENPPLGITAERRYYRRLPIPRTEMPSEDLHARVLQLPIPIDHHRRERSGDDAGRARTLPRRPRS